MSQSIFTQQSNTSDTPIAIVYHNGCQDGLTSLGIALYHFVRNQNIPQDDINIVAGVYQTEPDYSLLVGRNVLIVDFSYPLATLEKVLDVANSVLILDHHISAYDALKDYSHAKLEYIYDVNQCGALITWKRFFIHDNPPEFLKCVNDRDLWLKKIVESEYFSLALTVKHYDQAQFARLVFALIDESYQNSELPLFHSLLASGKSYQDYRNTLIKMLAKNAYSVTLPDGIKALKCNAPLALASDLGAYLAESINSVAWIYEEHEFFTQHSMRVATNCDFDCSQFAKQYGGGGHKKASGWRVEHN